MAARDVFGIVGTTQAGNFHVERVVAEGGFGVVYRAQHGAFRAPVALKCLKIPEQMTKQQRAVFLEKFREEAELMFRLSAAIAEVVRPLHVDVLALPEGRFVPFIALEWLEGESLDGIIVRRREQGQAPLGLHKVVKMLRPGASALSRAHRFPGPQGAVSIIHRDLKPENVFVANIGGTESLKILDFGIAKAKRAASQAVGRITGRTLEEDESASFTPAYGAPEQWSPKTYGETGPWTDVWGLALTLVEALCGTPPIDGDTYVMRRTCLDERRRPTPRALGADVPDEIDRVFEKALAVDPRKRFKDIESFWSELELSMGLEPSLRTRDARREPSEGFDARQADSVFERGAAAEPSIAAAASRLARVELLKVPSVIGMPAVQSPIGPTAMPRAADLRRAEAAAPRWEESADLPRGEAAVGVRRAEPGSGALPSLRHAEAARPRAAARPEEDWASLGLGDGDDAAPLDVPPPRALQQPTPAQLGRAGASPRPPAPPAAMEGRAAAAPGAKPPMVRRASVGLELQLPMSEEGVAPPVAGKRPNLAELEAALGLDDPGQPRVVPELPRARSSPGEIPVLGARPQASPEPRTSPLGASVPGMRAAGQPPPAPSSRSGVVEVRPPMQRRLSGELELSLPIHDDGPPPPALLGGQATPPDLSPAEVSAPPRDGARPPAAPVRRASLELEMSLPIVDQAPDPVPGPPPAGATRPPSDDDGLDFQLHVPAQRPQRPAVTPPSPPPAFDRRGDAGDRELAPPPAAAPIDLRERLKTPMGLILGSLGVALVELVFHKVTGNPLELGPVRLTWIAAPLALVGVGFLLWRLIGVHADE